MSGERVSRSHRHHTRAAALTPWENDRTIRSKGGFSAAAQKSWLTVVHEDIPCRSYLVPLGLSTLLQRILNHGRHRSETGHRGRQSDTVPPPFMHVPCYT